MKKKYRSISVLFAAAIMITNMGCEQTVVCPAYDDANFAGWFPYSEGQVMIFKNKSDQADTIIIGKIIKSKRTEHTERIGGKQYWCEQEIQVTSKSGYSKLSIMHSKGEMTYNYINVVFKSLSVTANGIIDNGLDGKDRSKSWVPILNYNLDFDGKQYGVLQEIQVTDTSAVNTSKIDRLYIGKGYGIVGYRTYPEKEIWCLQ